MRCVELCYVSLHLICCPSRKKSGKNVIAEIDKLSARVEQRKGEEGTYIQYYYSKSGYGRLDYTINFISMIWAWIVSRKASTSYVYGADVAKIQFTTGTRSGKSSTAKIDTIIAKFNSEIQKQNQIQATHSKAQAEIDLVLKQLELSY